MKKIKYFLLLIPLLFISKVNALTFDNFEVTWYYRNKSDESELLNVLKQEDVPLYASTNEYVNGYTTRVEQTFTKQIQYIVNYQLEMWFSPEQELNYRSDTLQRIIDYSYVDSDFKILNTIANESWNRSTSGSGVTVLTINVSMQVLALNNTDAIRFGVYTHNNISIGFYNHTDQIDYYLVNNISIEENANATIIDQNNQIINGQNNLQNSITNTEDSINQNIDDMEQSIVDSNKETQDVIKDQFNSCRDSYNLFPGWTVGQHYSSSNGLLITGSSFSSSSSFISVDFVNNSRYYFSNLPDTYNIYISAYDENKNYIGRTVSNKINSYLFYPERISNFGSGSGDIDNIKYITITYQGTDVPNNTMLNIGSSAKPYELYGEEICNNKIDETNNQLNDLNNNLNNSDSTGATNDASNFFSNFTTDTFGLTSIITSPLSLINTITSSSCSTLSLPLPYLDNKYLELPCMNTIYTEYFGSFFNIYQTITFGIIAYWVIVRIFNQVKDFKNPDHDEIEVLDL